MEKLAQSLNLPLNLLQTVFILLINIPLAAGFRLIDRPILRYGYSLIFGLVFLVFLLQYWVLYVLSAALLPFVLFKIVGKHQYPISLATSFCFLMFIHTYRFMYDSLDWKIDCSVYIMMLVTKVVYFGNYVSHHKHHISLFKYLSYCFYFPAVLIGPSYSFGTFQNFIQKTKGYEKPLIKKNLLLVELVTALLFSIATAYLMPIFTPYWPIENKDYLALSPLMKFLLLNVFGVFYRIKFYSAWGFTQLALDFSGLSWNEKNQDYTSVRCGSPRFETELNPKNKTAYWNCSVQLWLKQMIFDKVLNRTKSSSLATFITFLTSALWHGVYLTYYVGFIQWAIIIIISKWAYKISQAAPHLFNNWVVKAIAFVVASSLLNYTGMFIVVLTWNEAVQCYRNMNFIGNGLMLALLVASMIIKPKMFKSKEHKEAAKVKHQKQQHEE